jgi:Tfp pilus assembly protein PilX
MRLGSKDGCRVFATWRRLQRDEEGIALVLAILIMLVLSIVLGSVIFMTAAAARDAHRSNAGQKASALAESGLNNALAVLNANYPGVIIYPGDSTLLLATTLTAPVTTLPASTTINVASTLGYNPGSNTISVGSSGVVTCTGISLTSFTGCTGGAAGTYPTGTSVARATAAVAGSTTWSGTLVNVPSNPSWKWQWQLTASGRVKNPTGPASDVVRTATAVVPVIIPDSASVDPGTSAVDWIYALHDVTFGQSVVVAAPVYTGNDLILANSATISETIPASLTKPARPNRIAVGHDLSLVNPQNSVGHVNGSADPANDLAEVHVGHFCASKANPTPHACVWGAVDKVWGVIHDNVIPADFITVPTLTCCSPVAWAAPADGTSHPGSPSYMGFWYMNAGLGPKTACATATGAPPNFDTGDNTLNQSAYSQGTPFDLTGATYSCTSADGKTKLAWDATTRVLTVKGTIFIDGSAKSSAGNANYVGKGTIILSGLFTMGNNTALCVNISGSTCDTSAAWDADTTALAIVADGLDPMTGDSIDIKKGNFQGLLLGNGNIDASVSGTLVIGPMVGVYGNVNAGQSGTLQFPPISFASSGTSGITGPLPLPQLLSPIQFGGG